MNNVVPVKEAVGILMQGGVGVLPTDTVYGLVARASDSRAVAKLYALKHREGKPGTVVAASAEQLVELGVAPEHLQPVLSWWPGALSVETPFSDDRTGLDQGTGHGAWRVVADDALRAILEITGPLLTSSANHPGKPGSVNVAEAIDYFGDLVDFYVDGGDLSGRKPSTVIRVKDGQIELIRQGAVDISTIIE